VGEFYVLKVYGFIVELFLNEKSTSSFGSAIVVSNTSLNDILGVRVERGKIKYDLWIGFGIKPPVHGAGREVSNVEGAITRSLSC
jgi:hypothetical protein